MTRVPGAAFWHVPPRCRSLLPAVEKLAAALGRPLDPEQRAAVEALTGIRPDGRPAALVSVIICPRQNMKTWIMMLIVLARLLEPGGDRLIVWSAHLFDTAQETFRDFLELIAANPWLDDLVEKVDRGNGEEQITFLGGRRLRFRARAKTGGRGLSGDCIVLDEGFALLAAHMGALLPILSTRRRALVLIGSSAGLAESAILRDFRDRGRAGDAGAPAYVEFCAPGSLREPGCDLGGECSHEPGTDGCALDREDAWLAANPAAKVGRISLDYLRQERAALPWQEFARERLGWWDEPAGEGRLTEALWLSLADPGSKPNRLPVGLALDTSRGLASAVVSACGWRPDGRASVEILRIGPGVDWLADYLPTLGGLNAPVGMLGGSATAKAVVPLLKRARVKFEELPQGDYAAACGLLVADATGDRLRHLGDQLLQRAVAAATSVPVGDAGSFRWSPNRSSGDITALVAATLARWQLERSPGVASSVF